MCEQKGWVKLYRSLLDWEWYDDVNTKIVFLHILLKANWEETKWHGEIIPAGSLKTTLPELAKELHISVRSVRTALEHLKSTDNLTVKTTSKYRIISITNWCKYQLNDRQTDSQATAKRQSNDSQATDTVSLYKEEKEIKNVKKREKAAEAASPSLEEIKKYVADNSYSISPERFYNYYSARGWSGISNWYSLADEWERTERQKVVPVSNFVRESSFDDDLSDLTMFLD